MDPEKLLADNEEKSAVSEDLLTALEEQLKISKDALIAKSTDDVTTALSNLQAKAQEVTAELYSKAHAAAQEVNDVDDEVSDSDSVADDDVVDSTFEDEKEQEDNG